MWQLIKHSLLVVT